MPGLPWWRADMCLLGEPTEGRSYSATSAAVARIRVHGNFIHTAFSEGQRGRTRSFGSRRRPRAEWIRRGRTDPANGYRGAKAIVNVGAIEGGFGWAVSYANPTHADLFLDVRVPPPSRWAVARREVLDLVRRWRPIPDHGVEGEVYVTAPGAEIDEHTSSSSRSMPSHARYRDCCRAGRDPRRCSDASALTRYGIPTVNYGTLTGLLERREGREPRVEALRTGRDLCRVAMRVCEVA